MRLNEFTTKELVEELQRREGVSTVTVEYCETKNVTVEGHAVVLVVEDQESEEE